MFAFLLATVSLMSEPIPDEQSTGFTSDDFPPAVQFAGHLTGSRVQIIIRPDGTLRDCHIVYPSGNQSLDAMTCDIFLKRFKFKTGAKWIDGGPAYYVYRQSVVWITAQHPTDENTNGDLNLEFKHLPFGLIHTKTIPVVFAADEAGKIVSCEAPKPAHDYQETVPFDRLQFACDQLIRSFKVPLVLDEAGKPVRSVQNATVRLVKQH